MGWYLRQDIAIKYPPLKVKIQLLRRIVFYTEGRDRKETGMEIYQNDKE